MQDLRQFAHPALDSRPTGLQNYRMTAAEPTTRSRLLAAMIEALRSRGLHGVGLAELLATAQAPKGVLYHHFPGGKTELAVAAIDQVVASIEGSLRRLLQDQSDPVAALRMWLGHAGQQLQRSGFERGCPLAAVALESTPADLAIRAVLARGFATLRQCLADVLLRAGLPTQRARGFAVLIVSAYEGALMQARVAAQPQLLQDSTDTLLSLLDQELKALKS